MLVERGRGDARQPLPPSWQALHALAECAPFGIYVVDSDLRIVLANAVAQRRILRSVQPAVGQDLAAALRALWPDDVAGAILTGFRCTLATGAPWHSRDEVHGHKDGEDGEADAWELHRIRLPDGSLGVACYCYESPRVRAEQALRDADHRKDEFLALLAHELRNPLAAISNAGHILQRSEGDAQMLRATGAILQRQVALMVRQVDDLLDMSRIRRGELELRKECINLAKVASDAVESTRPVIEAAHHELSIELPQAPLYVLGDPVRLAQVLGNLLDNAARFTQRGGRIWLAIEQQAGDAVVRVRDNGVGIPDSAHERIFELYVQLGQSEHARGGLGLGLALVRKLVELHGGSVGVDSKGPAQGTEFTVRLPALTNLQQPPAEPGAEPGTATRCRVLVVDDNRDSANSLATLLSLLGHDAETAHDGVEAVKKAVTFRADLILLDIGMPRLDGHEAARWIREQGHRNLTIVALTGWGQEEDRRRSAEAGFDAHVVKPIDVATLTRLLAAAGRRADDGSGGPDSGA